MPDFLQRRNKLREIFLSSSNATLFFDAVSIRYLSGFSGSNAALLIGSEAKDDLLLTDERYTKRAKDEAIDIKIEISRDFVSIIKREVARLNFAKIAIDPKLLTFSQAEFMQKDLNLELVKFKDFLSPLRMIKDEYEIKQIKKACAITADTLWFLIN
ncbi:MAG: aminopeptidase P family N-terminal domain-containing protein, partial [Actinomycetes bacterium]